jgi:hypothetical protein
MPVVDGGDEVKRYILSHARRLHNTKRANNYVIS